MPTVIRESGYRVAFFSADANEPPHVHVSRESKEAKFWMQPFVRLSKNKGFRPHELNEIEQILTVNREIILEAWNATLDANPELDVRATAVRVSEAELTVEFEDGRTLSVPTAWYPRLHHGTPKERANLQIGAFGIHWPDLDEDISYSGLLLGRRSGESSSSLKFWLDARKKGKKATLEDLVKSRRSPKGRRQHNQKS